MAAHGMISGMTKAKIAVTLPPALVTRAHDAVREGRAPSISAYVAAAMEEKAKLDDLKAMLDEMLAESGGPLTDRERIAADAALGIAAERKRKHRRK
ncbi:MAG TPA: toxin-antitoxin system antitoxin subunit [Gammaproteobacteria bacterium]|nr:toxin-antitoxin system antitoxin subunit [Gammaproteobacteria bacterium]